MIEAMRAFAGGYCRQVLAMVDRRSLRLVRFEAVFLALRHRREGWVLVDTGYGSAFRDATSRLPYRFYRWATPATPAGTAAGLLAAAGIRPHEIRHVIVTHFHADHIGGLREFPQAVIHYHGDALSSLQQLSPVRQVRAAFLPALVPAWLPDRAHVISAGAFVTTPDLPFVIHDLFDDGSIRLVNLPGHAPGHIGIAFTSAQGPELYATDAYWRSCQVVRSVEPVALAMSLQWNAADYRATVGQLRTLARHGNHRLHACHDDGTCAKLNGVGP